MFQVAEGKDHCAERAAQHSKGTFEELAANYCEFVKTKGKKGKPNKSWKQADTLVRRYLLPRWGKLQSGSITLNDVKTTIAGITAPILANQGLAAASAVRTLMKPRASGPRPARSKPKRSAGAAS
jgi:hypothetical protein